MAECWYDGWWVPGSLLYCFLYSYECFNTFIIKGLLKRSVMGWVGGNLKKKKKKVVFNIFTDLCNQHYN